MRATVLDSRRHSFTYRAEAARIKSIDLEAALEKFGPRPPPAAAWAKTRLPKRNARRQWQADEGLIHAEHVRWLGVVPSFGRPNVSDDNPYVEALFRTLKYRPGFASQRFVRLIKSMRQLS